MLQQGRGDTFPLERCAFQHARLEEKGVGSGERGPEKRGVDRGAMAPAKQTFPRLKKKTISYIQCIYIYDHRSRQERYLRTHLVQHPYFIDLETEVQGG